MKKTLLILALVTVTGSLFAQKKTTTSATVAFDASTPKDALPKAENKTAIAAIDTKTGTVQFEANVKNFAFSNPTIQEHFNGERWLNSDTYSTFSFKGTVTNLSEVNFAQNGTYNANVEGTLTIKGKEQKVKAPATIVVNNGAVSATSNFAITLADYGITVDGEKIAKEPKITVAAEFK